MGGRIPSPKRNKKKEAMKQTPLEDTLGPMVKSGNTLLKKYYVPFSLIPRIDKSDIVFYCKSKLDDFFAF